MDRAVHAGHHRPAGLRVRPEELPLDRHVQALVMHIADDPHHREARPVGPAQPDRSADRIFLGPKGARHRLVDDDRSRRTDGILRRELPPLQDRNAHGPEVVWAGDAVARARQVPGGRRRPSLDLEAPARVPVKGQMPDGSYGHHARDRAHVLLEIPTKARQTGRTDVNLFLWTDMPTVSTFFGFNPGSTPNSRVMLLIISPAPHSTTIASATSDATST